MSDSKHSISIQPGYVLVERAANYEVIASEQPAMLMDISAACKGSNCRKVLVVGTQTKVQLSTLDIFNLGEQLSRLGLQIAIVESHDASSEDVRLLEDVTKNRGGSIQFFTNEEDAREWSGIT